MMTMMMMMMMMSLKIVQESIHATLKFISFKLLALGFFNV